MDIVNRGYHKCDDMPEDEFMEIQQTLWHIHKTNKLHSEYRINVNDGICPYCGEQLSR